MRLRSPGKAAREDNVLPLINIVFLLLIFFMLAGRMVPPPVLEAEPPRAVAGEPLEQEAVLVVDAGGRMAWSGEPIEASELAARAREWNGKALAVKADGRLAHNALMRRIEALRAAGVREVVLMTEPKR